jgi:hypothetical protein
MKGFQMSISIKEKVRGSVYAHPFLETGFMDVNQAIEEANSVIEKKFGGKDRIEITRQHRKRRD